MQVAERIHADDEEEIVLRKIAIQQFQGTHRITFSCPAGFEIGGDKSGIAGNGGLNHGEAAVEGNLLGYRFVRGVGGRNEQDAVEGAGFAHLLRNAQVREVNRIEGAAEDTGAHQRKF